MRLTIVTAVCGALEVTRQWGLETMNACISDPEVVVVSNGNNPAEFDYLYRGVSYGGVSCVRYVRVDEPLGSARAFNRGLAEAPGDVVALLHNDLMVRQPGWDATLLAWFHHHPDAGVVGFHGARGLGAAGIYRTPYRLEQLARWDTMSNLEDAEAHGARRTTPARVAVVDGMAICARRADLVEWGGLDESLGPHHMYDNDICLTALAAGRVNYMLPIRARHLSGQTANFPRYQESVAHLGGDAGVHRTAHERFYEKWRGRLPAVVTEDDVRMGAVA